MKRVGNIFESIYSIDNLRLADQRASRGKSKQYGVIRHRRNDEQNLYDLHKMLRDKTYQTSDYDTFKVFETKERLVYRLPYFPDRIAHHAIMNILEPVFVSVFTANSYSCIKGKGIHGAFYDLKDALKDVAGTTFCLKLDITKFYPTVDHDILKALIRRKFKDKDLLWLLDEIIDSAPGLPIGNYLSQYLANFYLTYFDHWLKENKRVKYYFRYADDVVILADDKEYLHQLLAEITNYLQQELKLTVKGNYQVFPVAKRGIDVLGYVFYHTHIRLRKRIKKNFIRRVYKTRRMRKTPNRSTISAYNGWISHCNGKHLMKKITKE